LSSLLSISYLISSTLIITRLFAQSIQLKDSSQYILQIYIFNYFSSIDIVEDWIAPCKIALQATFNDIQHVLVDILLKLYVVVHIV
jgi:hypothetical protein